MQTIEPYISLAINILIVIATTFIAAKIVNRLLSGYFKDISKRLNVEETVYTMLRRLIILLVYFIGAVIIISMVPQLKVATASLLAAGGVVGIIIGLAAQSTMSNVIAGVSIAVSRPFRVGDRITIGEEYGLVEDITLRQTVINTWENKRLIIPNAKISEGAIINWTIGDLPVLWHTDFGIAYGADIDLARSIILDEVKKHPNVMHDRSVNVSLTELGDFAVNMRSTFWVPDRGVAWGAGCDIRESVKKRFDKEGVEIPFPYRTIVFKKDMDEGENL
ncbi:MAG: Small-conductance mechanosensitive channel MscMJ [Candidatus Methanolliviera sp. GoM_oil]|nr:MAG: Small-conductance mechanosensitive channel MscMJ [Candidatus Methanolliviera sp. GoM_oil]